MGASTGRWALPGCERPSWAIVGDVVEGNHAHRRSESGATGGNRHGNRPARRHQQGLRERLSRDPRPGSRDRRQGVPGARWSVGLRQVDRIADDRRPRDHLGRHDEDRRPGRQRRRAEGPRHRDGLPELRAVSAHDGVRQHRLRARSSRRCPKERDRHPCPQGRRDPRARGATSTASPASSPVASASGSRWAARSCASRRRS